MSENSHIKLLVIPELFPLNDNDHAGLYMPDYIKAVQSFCDVSVFYPRLVGQTDAELIRDPRGFSIRYFALLRDQPRFLKRLFYVQWFSRALKVAKKMGPFDLIHAHGPLLHGNLAVQLGKHWNIPVVLSVHTGPFSSIANNPFYARMAKRSIERADLTLAVSADLQNDILHSGFTPKRIEVSGNPVNDELFKPAKNKTMSKKMLFVSRLDENKGGLRTLKAFHKASVSLEGWQLLVVGKGREMAAMERYISQHGLEKKVRMLGKMGREKLAQTMATSDFLVFPSEHETFGLVPHEALCAGIPVITSNTTALKEWVPAKAGLQVDPLDVEAIAAAMLKMADSLDQYRPEELRATTVSRFGNEAFGMKMKGLYQSLLSPCVV